MTISFRLPIAILRSHAANDHPPSLHHLSMAPFAMGSLLTLEQQNEKPKDASTCK
jgi:hypothetical protein